MAAQKLRWLTYLLTDLGEAPRSPPVLRAAEQQRSRAAESPDTRATQQPSHPKAEPPSSRAARAAQQPSRPSRLSRPSRPSRPSRRAALQSCRFYNCRCAPALPTQTGEILPCWLLADGLSLFDLTSGASPAPPATADSTARSQWATRDAAARLAVRRHLPTTERAHISQYKNAQTLYDAVVARYSSPATAALSRLFLPYLFPDLAAFPTIADLITHLRTSNTRFRAALPAEFCAKNPPPIYLTLYYVVTRLPDSLRVVRDHFLSVCPVTLTVDLLEKRLLVTEQSIVAVGASRGDPRTPIFEGCSPSPLLPSVVSAVAADLDGFESPGGAEPGGAEPGGAEPGGTEPGGAESGGAGSARVASRGASSRRELLSPQELRKWFARRWSRAAGAGGTTAAAGSGGTCPGGAGAAGPGGAAEAAGVGPAGGSAGASGRNGAAGSAGTGAAGAAGAGTTGGVGAGGSADAGSSEGAGDGATGAGVAAGAGAAAGSSGAVPAGSGGATRLRPYIVPLLEQVLGLPPSPRPPPFECPRPVQSQSQLQPRRAPASRPASPARTALTSRPRPPAVPGTHQMALRPSIAPLRVPLPSPPASSLPVLANPASDSLRAASPTVTHLLARVVTDPSLESTAASALITVLVDFAACCRLDYAASLVAESASVCSPSVGGECALSTDVLEDKQEEFQCFAAALPHLVSTLIAPEGDPDAPDIPTPRSYAEAIEGPYSSQWQAAMDAEMASWKSTGTYVDEVPPPGANIVSGMWIFRVKRPPGSPPVFKARYVARGFSQRQGVDYFQTFYPTPKMTTLRVLLHLAAQRDYELHSLDFSTAFLQGSLHEEI
ncbi:unnamed protein product [Closterium sp. NIES-54]